MRILESGVGISHQYAKKVIKTGDIVVDATAGNGNDTLFLAEHVGENGHVYCFDIQKQALENTRKKIEEHNMQERVSCICDGHQNMDKYIEKTIKLVVFNLGYLPGGDHTIHTKPDTTIQAIEKTLDLICKNGLVIVVVYYGGDSGFEEKDALMQYLKQLDYKKYTVLMHNYINQVNCPPIAVCIEKIR